MMCPVYENVCSNITCGWIHTVSPAIYRVASWVESGPLRLRSGRHFCTGLVTVSNKYSDNAKSCKALVIMYINKFILFNFS